MIHLSCFIRSHQPVFKRGSALRVTTLIATFILAIFLCVTAFSAGSPQQGSVGSKAPQMEAPDVLVLVMTGLGPFDQISINYTTQVSDKNARNDLAVLARLTGWNTSNATIRTETASVPGAKPATSSSFLAQGIINAANGTLPVEPFIDALKRFKSVQVSFIVPSDFKFRGLKDFENEYVKITLNQSKNSFLYKVRVKDSDFERLNLPVTQESAEKREANSGSARFMLILGIALFVAVFVYFIAVYISKNRKT